jgi:hypothetical protein
MAVLKFICHSYHVISQARQLGWLPGARYTNLRDVRKFDRLGFLDIDWKDYNYRIHLQATKDTRPMLTVARDIIDASELGRILDEAFELSQWAEAVVIVPKDLRLEPILPHAIPKNFLIGYSVPSGYGDTELPLTCFTTREVHLLGGHPARQRALGNWFRVVSLDCNRFTLDATFGDFFDGETFRPHPIGGYELCIRDSLLNINRLWDNYANSISKISQSPKINISMHGGRG